MNVVAKRRKCNFNENLKKEFPFIVANVSTSQNINGSLVKCTICSGEFSIAFGGKSAITKHINTTKHQKQLGAIASVSKVTNFFKSSSNWNSQENQLINQMNEDWNIICLICLKDCIESKSIYEVDENNISISSKIMECSNMIIQDNLDIPQQICNTCYRNLVIAYQFRKLCEMSFAKLRSILATTKDDSIKFSILGGIRLPNEIQLKLVQNKKNEPIQVKNEECLGECIEECTNGSNSECSFEYLSKKDVQKEQKILTIQETKKQIKDTKFSEETSKFSTTICHICGNIFNKKYSFKLHMKTHLNVRRFKCEFCDKSFTVSCHLKRHMRVHTGEKPYSCKYCHRCFSDYGTRTKHERTHTGERPYVCKFCGRGFSVSHVLNSHIAVHTGEKKFKCELCGKSFAKKCTMQVHIKGYHLKIKNET